MKPFVFCVLGTLLWALGSNSAWAQKTFCSMTLNSDDELRAFRRHLSPQGFRFVELVPNNKDPDWFRKACQSGVKCDVLAISGHFGGLYFGEKSTPILKLSDMERASCDRSCAGILESPKEVFLLGCNTLAGKSPDHRTPMQYLRILVGDGFPRDEAERIVTSRYSQEGFSMAQRSALSFVGAKKVYGFDGTGPLGAQAAPRIRRYLESVGNYSSYLDRLTEAPNSRLANAFSGFSIRAVSPAQFLDAETRKLSCDLRFARGNTQKEAFQGVLRSGRFREFLDHLRDQEPSIEFKKGLDELLQERPGLDAEIKSTILKSLSQHAELLSVKSGLLRASHSLGHLSSSQWRQELNATIETALKRNINLVVADQICDLAQKHTDLVFSARWLQDSRFRSSEYLPFVMGCFLRWENNVLDWFKQIDLTRMPKSYRLEMLRTLKGRWTSADLGLLLSQARLLNSIEDRYELYRSAYEVFLAAYQRPQWRPEQREEILEYFPSVDPHVGAGGVCLHSASKSSDPQARDARRWQCLEGENLATDLWSCLKVSSQMELPNKDGVDWQCLLKPNPTPTLGLCLDLAARNPDPEKADDMRWTCWDKHKVTGQFSRPECLRLAASMGIEGNRIKANWNCMNMKESGSPAEEYTFLQDLFESRGSLKSNAERLPANRESN